MTQAEKDTSKYHRIKEEVEANNPPVEAGQIWYAAIDDKRLRRIRLLVEYPNFGLHKQGGKGRLWIYEELEGTMRGKHCGEIGLCPEFNLRYVFTKEESND